MQITEIMRSRVILKTKPAGWFHDTQLCSHIEDNRRGITGLKFQAIIRYGLIGYNAEVEHYITSDANHNNGFNRIKELSPDTALIYCGIDSLVEHRLFMDQASELGISL
jgi:hypothetical protein